MRRLVTIAALALAGCAPMPAPQTAPPPPQASDPDVPVHLIGGIASDATNREVGGFARAAVDHRALGASLYDAPITSAGQWRRMQQVARMSGSSRPPHSGLTPAGENAGHD